MKFLVLILLLFSFTTPYMAAEITVSAHVCTDILVASEANAQKGLSDGCPFESDEDEIILVVLPNTVITISESFDHYLDFPLKPILTKPFRPPSLS